MKNEMRCEEVPSGHNPIGQLTNDGRMAYFWNDENRLVAVRSAKTGALIQENRYDGLGRRREKVEFDAGVGVTNRYIYKDWLVLAITDGEGNVLETYTHGADLSGHVGGGAGGIGGILASTQAGGPAYYHYDFNGNIVNVSSSNQTQLARYTYSPFGEVLLKDGAFNARYKFSTKEFDASTGLNYYGYRFYSPSLGRWLNRDPIEELGSINIYEMSFNNFINNIDYLGLCNPGDTQTYLRNCHIKNGKKTGNYTTEQENNWWLLIGSGGGIVQVKFICNCEVEGDNYCDEVTEECKCKKTSIKGCCVIGEYDWVETNVEEKYINSGGKEYQEIFNDTQTFKAEDLKGPLFWIASMLGICQQSCSK